jgi:hypothetical protein
MFDGKDQVGNLRVIALEKTQAVEEVEVAETHAVEG